MDCSTDFGGLSVGHSASVSRSRPGQRLWIGLQKTGPSNGHWRSYHCSQDSLAERLRREVDRVDQARMLGPPDFPRRGALAQCYTRLCRLLQWLPHSFVVGQEFASYPANLCRKHRAIARPECAGALRCSRLSNLAEEVPAFWLLTKPSIEQPGIAATQLTPGSFRAAEDIYCRSASLGSKATPRGSCAQRTR